MNSKGDFSPISDKPLPSGRQELIKAEVLKSPSIDMEELDKSIDIPPEGVDTDDIRIGNTTRAELAAIGKELEEYVANSQPPSTPEEIERRKMSIWSLAVIEQQKQEKQRCMISTLFLIGNKGAGKTSLINCFLEKTNAGTPRPTLALDFCFARRTTPSDFKKHICHIWELGGDVINNSDHITPPITACGRLDKLSIAIVLDLSEPNNMWATLEATFHHVKKAFSKALVNIGKEEAVKLSEELEAKANARLSEAVQDKDNLEPFPLPVLIICTKYDIFQNFEPEKRKTICRLLRTVAHRFGASLNFYSKNELALTRRIRELFAYCGFETEFPTEICLDMMTKPLLIPFGGDSYQEIWPGVAPSQLTLEYCRHLYETKVGKTNAKFTPAENPALDPNFREHGIDQRRTLALEKMKEKIAKKRDKVAAKTEKPLLLTDGEENESIFEEKDERIFTTNQIVE